MSKHTKGRWHYRVDMSGMPEGIFVFGSGKVILSRLEPAVPLSEADARLIAAAPDMLKALKKCISSCGLNLDDLNPDLSDENAMIMALAAIKKAEGK